MSAIRASIIASAADRYATQALTIATLAIMSRILTPAEIGLYMVVNSLIMVADNLRAFGVGVFIVQERTLERVPVRAAFTVTMILSLAMALAIFGSADGIADFYGEPALRHLMALSALGFIVVPFGSPIIALLQRDLAFRTLAVLNVTAAAINSSVTIALGATGHGPASYVWGSVAASSAIAVLAFAVRPEAWIFRPSFVGVRRVMSFGVISCSSTLLNLVTDMLPRLAFGKMLGFDAVGLYGRSLNICQIPDRAIASALQPVVLPAMAAHARAGGDLREGWLRGHTLMSAVQWPTLAMLALLADPVVRLLLGSQWGEAAPLVRIIAFAMMALAPAFMTFPVLVASGRIRDTLISSLIVLPPSAAVSIGAAHFGLTAVALSLFVTAPAQMLVALFFVRRAIGLRWPEIIRASRVSAAITAGTILVPTAVILLSPNGFALDWVETAVAVLGGATGWIATLWAIDHPLRVEIVVVGRMAVELLARYRAPAE